MKIPRYTSLAMAALCLPLAPLAQANELKPSRLVAPEQFDQQLGQLHEVLAMAERQFDPFGQSQDSTAKPVIKQIGPVGGDVEIHEPLPFGQLVERIPIAAVMPGEGRVLINGRFFEIGQKFPAVLKGRKFELELIKVKPGAVEFRNVKNGEVAVQKFNEHPDFLKQDDAQRPDFAPKPLIDLN